MAKWVPPARYEIARIEEKAVASGGGVVCFILLALHQLFVLLIWFGAKGAIQEAAIGAIWVAGNVLWGIGIIVGRKRTYFVTREVQPPDPPAA